MGDEVREAFLEMIMNDFKSIVVTFMQVDVAKAECRDKEAADQILRELEDKVGAGKCNQLVIGVLREAMVEEGRRAVAALPKEERECTGTTCSPARRRRSMAVSTAVQASSS